MDNTTNAPPARRIPPSDQRGKLDTIRLSSPDEARVHLDALRTATAGHIAGSKSEATKRAYASDFGAFELWCHRYGLASLPADPDTVALYLTAMADQDAAVATLRKRLVAISQAHKAAGVTLPPTQSETVRRTIAGIARARGTRQRQVAALRVTTIKDMLAAMPEEDLLAIRDRAILLLGFAGGMRRSEIAALDASDITEVDEGLDVLIRRSKTDQEAAGRIIGIPRGRHPETCPVIAVRRWMVLSGITGGALFRLFKVEGA